MTKYETLFVVLALVAIGVAGRLLPHLPNFAPVTASALFCGAYMNRRVSFAALGVTLLISDYLLLYVSPYSGLHLNHVYEPWALWHTTLPYVYGSFALSALAGWFLKGRRSPGVIGVATVFCSLQFFLITNAGVWAAGAYDRGINGLWESYVAGLPFFRGTLLGDLFYTSVFFGLWEFASAFRREAAASTAYAVD
ncbi:MAG TPA: DUF6580 family putative transport protein [Dehalococcoidia bacterium]|nr:DUF6580 family putative transport protein [Dehalococcoidia bacterium]